MFRACGPGFEGWYLQHMTEHVGIIVTSFPLNSHTIDQNFQPAASSFVITRCTEDAADLTTDTLIKCGLETTLAQSSLYSNKPWLLWE